MINFEFENVIYKNMGKFQFKGYEQYVDDHVCREN